MPKRSKQTIIKKNEGTCFSGKTFSQHRPNFKGLGLWSRPTSLLDYEFYATWNYRGGYTAEALGANASESPSGSTHSGLTGS